MLQKRSENDRQYNVFDKINQYCIAVNMQLNLNLKVDSLNEITNIGLFYFFK